MTGLIFVLALLLQSIRDMGRDYGRVRFDVLSAHGGKPERVVTVIQVRLLMAPAPSCRRRAAVQGGKRRRHLSIGQCSNRRTVTKTGERHVVVQGSDAPYVSTGKAASSIGRPMGFLAPTVLPRSVMDGLQSP
jgi:hypothetical protein